MDARDNNESLDDNAEGSRGINSNKIYQRKPEPHECGDHLFTPVSNQSESSGASNNGPHRHLASRDEAQQLAKPRDNIPCQNLTYPGVASSSQPSNNISNQPASSRYCDNGLETNEQACQSYMSPLDRVGNNQNASSSGSSQSKNENKECRKRPSSLQLNNCDANGDDSSSDTGNDECSLGSEDGCVYTYRGGEHLADLPSSFFSLDMGLPLDKHLPSNSRPLPNFHGYPIVQRPEEVPEHREVVHEESPDIDFDPLEMDFDPGPSVEVDGDEPSPELDILPEDAIIPVEEEKVLVGTPENPSNPTLAPHSSEPLRVQPISRIDEHYMSVPSTSSGITRATAMSKKKSPEPAKREPVCDSIITHVNVRGERLTVKRTTVQPISNTTIGVHSSGDLVSPREMVPHEDEMAESPYAVQINRGEMHMIDPMQLNSTLYHLSMAKRLVMENTAAVVEANDISNCAVPPAPAPAPAAPVTVPPPRRMVWSEREACERQVTQIGTSACGATAVVNVFIALGVPVNVERINEVVGTRQRANNAPLPRYLLSRAVAGCTAADLVAGIQRASDGVVTARFFPTYPERIVSLSHWLADWISLGAIPILTLNLQAGCPPGTEPPDAWHHQMVFGVSSRGVFLSNPVERVTESALWARLTSPSVLLVRTRDVLARFNPRTDLSALAHGPGAIERFNVLGQVVNLLREWRDTGWSEQGIRTRHIRLPAAYRAGVTVAALTGSEAHRRLMHATQLPLLDDSQEETDK